ncbi:hypothetical protein ACFC0D_22615 [Streptomyces sp. NPDC056222]|uniref:hypothetical protein n=1 Tax=Streptomyces sp. NPDC056222 TaxID=3345749 RepID=UPI0035E0F232
MNGGCSKVGTGITITSSPGVYGGGISGVGNGRGGAGGGLGPEFGFCGSVRDRVPVFRFVSFAFGRGDTYAVGGGVVRVADGVADGLTDVDALGEGVGEAVGEAEETEGEPDGDGGRLRSPSVPPPPPHPLSTSPASSATAAGPDPLPPRARMPLTPPLET